MAKCRWCGKDLEQRGSMFCCEECEKTYNDKLEYTKERIIAIAEENNLELKNFDKIVRAKMLLFGQDNTMRCPCLADSEEHYCGSPRCLADAKEEHCHCQLMWKK
ncbi:MAG: hypothetical protein NC124_02070 [Clostridium sp.]|nr:hypothetical protein [Clostridium sp.]